MADSGYRIADGTVSRDAEALRSGALFHFPLATVLLASLAGCGEIKSRGVSPTDVRSPVVGAQASAADQRLDALLAGQDADGDKAVPVDEFFAKLGQGYMIWKGEAEWFKTLAVNAKAAGAPAMYAVVGDAFGSGVQVAAEYVIVMPTDSSARAKVIEAYNNFWKRGLEGLSEEERRVVEGDLIAEEYVKDQGQKYLSLMYDP